MAMWIELHTTFADHPKVRKAARALTKKLERPVTRNEVRGAVVSLWCHCVDHAPTGMLQGPDGEGLDIEEIGHYADWQGDPQTLVNSLVAVGLLDNREDGLWIHDWDEYAGASIAKLNRSKLGSQAGNHKRHHTLKNVVDASCYLCTPTEANHRDAHRGLTDPECQFCLPPSTSPNVAELSTTTIPAFSLSPPDSPPDKPIGTGLSRPPSPTVHNSTKQNIRTTTRPWKNQVERLIHIWATATVTPISNNERPAQTVLTKLPGIEDLTDTQLTDMIKDLHFNHGTKAIGGIPHRIQHWNPPTPWCGHCDQSTRMNHNNNTASPCPTCHPTNNKTLNLTGAPS